MATERGGDGPNPLSRGGGDGPTPLWEVVVRRYGGGDGPCPLALVPVSKGETVSVKWGSSYQLGAGGRGQPESAASAWLIVHNATKEGVHFVVQQETHAGAPPARWVLDLADGNRGWVGFQDKTTDRLVIAYQFGNGASLKRILAVAIVNEEDFFFSGDRAVFILRHVDNRYFFEHPAFEGVQIASENPRSGTKRGKPLSVAEFEKLREASAPNPFKMEQ